MHVSFFLTRWWHGRVDLHVHASFCCGNGGLIDSVAVWGVCMSRYLSTVVVLLIRWPYGLHVCVSFSYGNGGLIDFVAAWGARAHFLVHMSVRVVMCFVLHCFWRQIE